MSEPTLTEALAEIARLKAIVAAYEAGLERIDSKLSQAIATESEKLEWTPSFAMDRE